MKNEYVKYGDTRQRKETLRAGDTVSTPEGVVFIKEESYIDVIEKFCKSTYSPETGVWLTESKNVSSIRPVNAPTAPVVDASVTYGGYGWLTRLRKWLGLGPKIPVAKVVER